MPARSLKRLHGARRDDIADLVTRRPLPNPDLPDLDPFLFLNHHGPQTYPAPNQGLPFGPHPHRGFQTVTLILDGDLMHQDSAGHQSVIRAGGVQWMVAGRGLIHAELSSEAFMQDGGPLEILQLWLNLPAALKLTEPAYIGLQADDLPCKSLDGGKASLTAVAGTLEGLQGPVEPLTDVELYVVRVAGGGQVVLPAPEGHTVFLYVVAGKVTVGRTRAIAPAHHLVEMHDDGDEVVVEGLEPAVLLYGHASPYREPIVAHGPFVMNTRAEIVQAVQDYEAGLFGPPMAGT